MRIVGVALIAVFILTGAVACSSSEDVLPAIAPSAAPSNAQPAASDQQNKSYDDLMREIGIEVHGFAGMSVEGHTVNVRATADDIDKDALGAAIVSRFPDLAGFQLKLEHVAFDFAQLSQWYQPVQDALYAVPEINPHIVSTDIDEIANCIVIGVDTEDAQEAAEHVIGTLDLPDGAVKVKVVERAVPL